ncbi:MAG: CapA family protein, partial [Oscillospiraceae bacterium]|nr:CapA family protein [Oscillospiraceae bacterium]
YWKTQKGVVATGAYKNQKDLDTVKKLKIKDITFSFVGITEHTNGINLPKDTDVKLIYSTNEGLIQSQIKKAKSQSDVAVVFIHWGTENSHIVTQSQKVLAKKMVGWGADVILGTHPHVLQPIEYLKKPNGKNALVIYSLGNFISAQSEAPNLIGGILDFEVTKEFNKNTIDIKDVKFIPTVTQYEGAYRNVRLYPMTMYTKELASKHGVRNFDSRFTYDFIKKTLDKYIGKKFLSDSK